MENQELLMLRRLLRDMSDGVLLLKMNGTILLHNHAAAQILAMPDDSLRGKSIAWIMGQTDVYDALFEPLLAAVGSRQKLTKTIPILRDDGLRYLQITTDFLMQGEEKIGVIVQICDVTDSAGLFIANKRLADQVVNLMNSFVEVMVTAIDGSSPYNANHTKSMVAYARRYLDWLGKQGELPEMVAANSEPFLMSVWLHDIGKLLIPYEIMDKPNRLGSALTEILHRVEVGRLMLRIGMLTHPEQTESLTAKQNALDSAEELIGQANGAGFLDKETRDRLKEAASLECLAADGTAHPLLTPQELEAITIERGTLTAAEREIMQSHVSMTQMLLSKVEFRGDYKRVPEWAGRHHELLDGSGYPDHLQGDELSWETRLLTILDIYDALTAEDRPYKKPMPPEKAFSILREMAGEGKLDGQIIESFYQSGAWVKHND
ncbi:MAG: PAS domain-containing protein [Oscillospiraceae bacterium]|nr:PAS domain-containing protein [Oscillospiraceae bacterium]